MFQDLKYGARMLMKKKSFTVIAILSLALGTGANTAIFSLINTTLLRPLPIERPSELVALNSIEENHTFPSFSYPNYKDFRDRNDVFSGLVGYRFTPLSMSHDGINERIWGYEVTGNYFDVLGVGAALGRTLTPDDDQTPGGHPVTVVSYKCWQQRFGRDPQIIGKEVIVNGRNYLIVGVTTQGFNGTEVISSPEFFFSIAMQEQLEPGQRWLTNRSADNVFLQGRLKPGISNAQAQASMNTIAAQLEREFPDANEGKRVLLSPPGLIGTALRGPVLGFAALMMAVVGLVLLLACTNLANLLLARATERRREIAVRLALGASRWRLIRQLLTESVMLAVGGGAIGLLPALWLVGLVTAIKMPLNVPLAFEVHIDYRVFGFAFLLSLATGILFGLLPALQATRTDLIPALKDEVAFGGHRRSLLKSGLIVAQISFSMVLLVGGGLMVRALQRAQSIDVGFEPDHAVEVAFDLRLQGYANGPGRELQKRLLERVRALPGVQSAGIADMVPVDLHFSRAGVFVEGASPERAVNVPTVMYSRVSPGYFQAMNTRILQGRDFTEQDDDKAARVAIVNATFAKRFFPGEDPLGKQFSIGRADATKSVIVGVVQDGKYAGLNEDPRPFVGRPIWQSDVGPTSVVVRTPGDEQSMKSLVSQEVLQLDPHIPMSANTLIEKMSLPLLPARIAASVLGGFGLLALALAAIGIYGVISYAVTSRTREIGVRMALGAQRADVLQLVLGQGMRLTLIGAGLGVASALLLTRLLKSLLFGVSATDLTTFAIASVLLTGVALLACYLPARRAARVDPMVALRHE